MNRLVSFYYQHIKPLFLRKPLFTPASEAPFFILSSGRSGSTLLRKLMLMNAPVNIPPESNDLIPKLIKFYLRYNHKPWEYIVKSCKEIYNLEPATVYWKAELKEENLQPLFSSAYKDKSLAGIIHFFYSHYAQVHGLEFEKWGEKTAFLIFRLSWINVVFPSAKFIFLVRDGRAVVNSFLKMNKGYDIESAAGRWLQTIKIIEKQQRKLGEGRILYIRYEDLVTAPEREQKKIYAFLDLVSRTQPIKKVFLGDDILNHHMNVRSEINPAYINKWERELSEAEIRQITERIGVKLRELGYD